jgi:hypothetical protein
MICDCKICNKSFKNIVSLNTHIGQKHKDIDKKTYAEKYKTEELIECSCGKAFYRSMAQQRKRKQQMCRECSKKNSVKKMIENGSFLRSGALLNKRLDELKIRNEIATKSAKTRKARGINSALKTAMTRKKNDIDSFKKSGVKAHLTRVNKGVYDRCRSDGTYDRMILKRHQTLKNNKSYGKSKAEDFFYNLLKDKFTKVNRQVSTLNEKKEGLFKFMKGYHNFDFVVDDMYFVCFDGIYYHGLDRPITEIAKCRTLTDKTIFDTYYRDRNLEDFCQKNDINLLRFNDINFKMFLSKKEKLIPYYVCGKSNDIDRFLNSLKEKNYGLS